MHPVLKTPLCDLLGIEKPVIPATKFSSVSSARNTGEVTAERSTEEMFGE